MEFENWNQYILDEVCTVTDCLHKTAPTVEYETPYRMLRTANIRNGKIDAGSTRSVTKETFVEWTVRGTLDQGDVILTREAPMGEVGIIRDEQYNFFLGQRLLQLKANRSIITPEFLYYSLQGRYLQHQIMMHEGTGSVVSNIRIPLLKKMKIHVPDLATQLKVTESLTVIDRKMEVNEKIVSTIERLTQTLFKRWFVDFEFPNEIGNPYKSSGGEMVESELGMIPKHFKIEHLAESVNFLSGGTPKTMTEEYWGGHIPFFTPKDITGSVYVTDTEKSITDLGLSNCNSKLYPKDTLFLTARGTVGKLNLANTEMAMNQSCFAMQHKEDNQYFLYFLVKTLLREIIQGSTGAVFNAINLKDLNSLKVINPSKDLACKYDNLVEPIFKMLSEKEEENISLKNLRDTLLPKLLSGEIELPDEAEVTEHVPVS